MGGLLLGLILLGGCESVTSRIDQRAQAYASWTPMVQARVRKGEIAPGDSFDMVFVALGAPDLNQTRPAAGAAITEWTYLERGERTSKIETVGYQQDAETIQGTSARVVQEVPIQENVVGSKGNVLQVVFRDGAVTGVRYVPKSSLGKK